MTTTIHSRRYDLDWLRIVVFGLKVSSRAVKTSNTVTNL